MMRSRSSPLLCMLLCGLLMALPGLEAEPAYGQYSPLQAELAPNTIPGIGWGDSIRVSDEVGYYYEEWLADDPHLQSLRAYVLPVPLGIEYDEVKTLTPIGLAELEETLQTLAVFAIRMNARWDIDERRRRRGLTAFEVDLQFYNHPDTSDWIPLTRRKCPDAGGPLFVTNAVGDQLVHCSRYLHPDNIFAEYEVEKYATLAWREFGEAATDFKLQ